MRDRGRPRDRVSGLPVWRCKRCGRRSFPVRELCPWCGGRALRAEEVERGLAAEVTSHRGTAVACVLVADDVRVLARVEGAVTPDSTVSLRLEGGAPVATASP